MTMFQVIDLTDKEMKELIKHIGGVMVSRNVLAGHAKLHVEYAPIDTSVPRLFKGFGPVQHISNGSLDWKPMEVELLDAPNLWRTTGWQAIHSLRHIDAPSRILNGAVLDFYLLNPQSIPAAMRRPERWSVVFYYFLGTIYWDRREDRNVIRALRRINDQFEEYWAYEDMAWSESSYIVLRA